MQLQGALFSAEFGLEVFPLAVLPSQIYLGRHSTKENTLFISSSIKSAAFVLLGSHLSTEQPHISPLLTWNAPQVTGVAGELTTARTATGWLYLSLEIQLIPLNRISHRQQRWVGESLTLRSLKSADSSYTKTGYTFE